MEIILFTLCDGVFNYNGKLTIVGTLDRINVRELPSRCNINIAIKIRVEPQKEALKEKISITIKNPDDELIPCEVNCEIPIKESEVDSYISMAINMQSVPLEKEGLHSIIVSVGDKINERFPFYVKMKKKQEENE